MVLNALPFGSVVLIVIKGGFFVVVEVQAAVLARLPKFKDVDVVVDVVVSHDKIFGRAKMDRWGRC